MDKIEVIEEFVSSILQGFITNLPYHIVTLQRAVHVSYFYYI